MTIKPLANRVLVKPAPAEEKMELCWKKEEMVLLEMTNKMSRF